MSRIFLILFSSILFSVSAKAQYPTLDQLISLRKYSVATIEEYLTARNWSFADASEETDEKMGNASFAYGRKYYDTDKATMFIDYMYSAKNETKRLLYQCHNPLEYNKLVARAKALGYTLLKSEIKDDYIVKVYRKGESVIRFKSIKDTQDYQNVTVYTVFVVTYLDWMFMEE
jgi:hypothetical protein